jgi:hypothetical protein
MEHLFHGGRAAKIEDVLCNTTRRGEFIGTLSEDQWKIATDLKSLLQPFMIAQRLLEGQLYIACPIYCIQSLERSHHGSTRSACITARCQQELRAL